MAIHEPSFTLGIEEEYLLVDKDSRDLAPEPPPALLAKCQEALLDYGSQVSPEFLRSQIEVGTSICHTMQEARDELVRLRTTVGAIADEFGLAPIASSTHPFAKWRSKQHTDKERYNVLAEDLQQSSREVVETLKKEGYTHVMLCPPDAGEAVEFDPTLGRLLAPWLAGREPIYARTSPTPTAWSGGTRSTSSTSTGSPALDGRGRLTR